MIRLELPWVPPSSNHAYFNLATGGRTLSTAGKKFKIDTTTHLARVYPKEMLFFKADKPLLVFMRFQFENVENSGFATGKAKRRYKTFDGGNRTKLLEDALKDAGGIDDAQTLTSIWQKVRGPTEHTTIWCWSLEEESTPFDATLRSLT